MIIAIAEFFCSTNCENLLVNKVFMICCVTCSWAPKAGGTTAQSGQRNDGVTAQKTQQLHQRLGHINWTLHAYIEKPTTLEKTFNNLQQNKFVYLYEQKIKNCVDKICIWLLEQHITVIHNKQYITQQTIHNTKYIVVISFSLKHFLAVFGEVVCLSWIGLGTGGSWTVSWRMLIRIYSIDR